MAEEAPKNKLNQKIKNALKKLNKKSSKKKKKPVKWFNKKDIVQKYESINPDIIPSLDLSCLNEDKFMSQYKYPNESRSCHWLIPGILLVGEDPTNFVEDLVANGVRKFICLYEWSAWYEESIDNILKKDKKMRDIELMSFPIEDFNIAEDKETIEFVENLARTIIKSDCNSDDEKEANGGKHVIYLHCLGGHGRTGLISSMLLSVVYGMDDQIAVKFLNEIHRMRHPHCGPNRMPESKSQRQQITNLHEDMINIRKKLQL